MKKNFLFILPMVFAATLVSCGQEISKEEVTKNLLAKKASANINKDDYKGVEIKGAIRGAINVNGKSAKTNLAVEQTFTFKANSIDKSYLKSTTKVAKDSASVESSIELYRVSENKNSITNALVSNAKSVIDGKTETEKFNAKETFTLIGERDQFDAALAEAKTSALDVLNKAVTNFITATDLPMTDIKTTLSNIFGNETYTSSLNANLNENLKLNFESQVKFKENYLKHYHFNFSLVHSKSAANFNVNLDINHWNGNDIAIPNVEYDATKDTTLEFSPDEILAKLKSMSTDIYGPNQAK